MPKPMFQKRHYEAFAQALQQATIKFGDVSGAEREIADLFARDNSLFDRARFEAACVPGANVKQRGAKLAKAVFANELRGIPRIDKEPEKTFKHRAKTVDQMLRDRYD